MFSSLLEPLRRALSGAVADPSPCGPALCVDQHVWCLALHGGTLFAGLADGRIVAWQRSQSDACSTSLVGDLGAHTGTVYALQVCESQLFSGGADGLVCAWRLAGAGTLPVLACTLRVTPGPPSLPVLALASVGEGEIFSGGADGHLRRWSSSAADAALYCTHTADGQATTIFALKAVRAGHGAGHGAEPPGGSASAAAASTVCVASAGSDAHAVL